MLTQPRLCAPVQRAMVSACAATAGSDQSWYFSLGVPAEGTDQSWNWWVGVPAEGTDQSWTPWVMPAEATE